MKFYVWIVSANDYARNALDFTPIEFSREWDAAGFGNEYYRGNFEVR